MSRAIAIKKLLSFGALHRSEIREVMGADADSVADGIRELIDSGEALEAGNPPRVWLTLAAQNSAFAGEVA
jgi:hypothetical protein